MSQATTGARQSLIASIAAAAGSRAAPLKPVPKIASTTAPDPSSRPAERGGLDRLGGGETLEVGGGVPAQLVPGPEQQRLDLEAGLGEQPGGDQPVAAVVPLAADHPHRALRRELGDGRGDGAPGRLHQLQRGDAALLDRPAIDLAHRGGVIERVEPRFHRRQRTGGAGRLPATAAEPRLGAAQMTGPSSPKPLGAAIATLLLCPLAAISCGGGGGDFVSEADGVCTEQAIRVNAVLDDGGTPQSAAGGGGADGWLLPIERDAVSRSARHRGTGGRRRRAAYRDFLAARGLALQLSERRGRAARRRASAAYATIDARRDRVLRRADASAARAGLLACAERLSRGAIRAVRAAITRIATSPDPALCSERFTANFVRSQFGDPRRCRRRQQTAPWRRPLGRDRRPAGDRRRLRPGDHPPPRRLLGRAAGAAGDALRGRLLQGRLARRAQSATLSTIFDVVGRRRHRRRSRRSRASAGRAAPAGSRGRRPLPSTPPTSARWRCRRSRPDRCRRATSRRHRRRSSSRASGRRRRAPAASRRLP